MVRIVCESASGFEAKITLEDGTLIPFVTGVEISVSADAVTTCKLNLVPGEIDVLAFTDWKDFITKLYMRLPKEEAQALRDIINKHLTY